jgi:glutamate-1-semialdehyde 2,1-aminomutase
MQELHQRGFLSVGTHNLNYAHGDAEIDALLAGYAEILPLAGAAALAGEVGSLLRCEPLVPLFRLR